MLWRWCISLVVFAGLVATSAIAAPRSAGPHAHSTTKPTGTAAAAATPPTLTFDRTCAPGRRAVIAAVGDLLFHNALQAEAYRPGRSFRAFWSPVAGVLAGADITYGNLESPIAAGVRGGGLPAVDPGRTLDRVVYGRAGEALIFNTHPSLATDLAAAGFRVVSTANNHAADRGALGIDKTLDALEAAGLAATGTRHRSASPSARWHATTSANGLTVAWLACTYGLNGMPDRQGQVLQCYQHRDVVMSELRALAGDPAIDAVILTPHWGLEGSHTPLASDRAYAREAIEAGATAVIGSHPHVLQPWEKIITSDGREGLVIYSTGNFISNQRSDAQRSGVIALLEVTRPEGGPAPRSPARLSAAGYVPTYVEIAASHRVTELTPGRAALGLTQRLLPAGNRVAADQFRVLPRICDPPHSQPDLTSVAFSDAPPHMSAPPCRSPAQSTWTGAIDRRLSRAPTSRATARAIASTPTSRLQRTAAPSAACPPYPLHFVTPLETASLRRP